MSVTGPFVAVTEFGAKGDGIQDDRSAIMRAIRVASQQRSGQVFLPRGTYQLQHVSGGELIGLDGIRGLRILGDQALLRCATPTGTTSVLKLTDCEDVSIDGLVFEDTSADRRINWKGAVAIYLSGHGERGNRNIRVANCRFYNMLAAFMVNDIGGRRATDIHLAALDIRSGYYGLSFQNNGDNVTATGISCHDIKRSYFPYGVTHHRIELAAEDNATGFTDVLIKCYGPETADLAIKLRSRRKRSGDAIVAFDQEHPDDRGMIRDIRMELDVADADCALNTVILIRAFTPQSKVLTTTASQWRNLDFQGRVEYCSSSTQLLTIGSQPQQPGIISMSAPMLRQIDKSSLRGFMVRAAAASVPGPVR